MRVAVSRKWRVPTFILDKLAFIIVVPKRSKNGLLGVVIVFPNEGFEVLGRLGAVVYEETLATFVHTYPRIG